MLTIASLGVSYEGLRALVDVSLEVGAGEFVTIVGPNGAGKTTLLKAISGTVPSETGRITYLAQDLGARRPSERAALGIAHVPEGRRVFPSLTVMENLELGAYRRAARASRKLALDEVLALFPILRERHRQLAGSLSGGEQQMLAIGRALMAEPRLLLVDELSLGLMPKMVDICLDVLMRLKREGLTIVLIEQNTARALDVADRVCVLSSGAQVFQGTSAEAKSAGSLFATFLGTAG